MSDHRRRTSERSTYGVERGPARHGAGRYTPPLDHADQSWLHLVDPDSADEERERSSYRDELSGTLTGLIDAFAEAFDARDLDATIELVAEDADLPGLGGDADGFAATLARCWDERPTAVLTRGLLRGDDDELQPVAVLWELGNDGAWRRSGLFSFDLADDEAFGLVEFAGDVPVVDEAEAFPPDDDPPEGARWEEWDEGADGP